MNWLVNWFVNWFVNRIHSLCTSGVHATVASYENDTHRNRPSKKYSFFTNQHTGWWFSRPQTL